MNDPYSHVGAGRAGVGRLCGCRKAAAALLIPAAFLSPPVSGVVVTYSDDDGIAVRPEKN